MERVSTRPFAVRLRGGALRLATVCTFGVIAGCAPRTIPKNVWGSLASSPRTSAKKDAPSTIVISQSEWSTSRARLAELRAAIPARAYVERVRVSIVEPRTGKRYEARGAVAVDPDKALRMMLIGPGGATAIDMWVTKDRFRFAVPSMKIETRGGRDPEEARGLPVGFFRWWFLSPASGRLLAARSDGAESSWLLRDGDAIVTMRSDGVRFVALRREGEHLEGIEWVGRGLAQTSGAHGRYVEDRYGLRVDVVVEEVLEDTPDPSAFDDPDAPEVPAPPRDEARGGTSL